MDHKDFVDECSFYLRQVRVLEDWFVLLVTRGLLKESERIVALLNEKRPAKIPTTRSLRWMTMEQLHVTSIELSLWSGRLMDIKDLVLSEKLVKALASFQIHTVLGKIESGIEFNSVRTFTHGIESIANIFNESDQVRSEAETDHCDSEGDITV